MKMPQAFVSDKHASPFSTKPAAIGTPATRADIIEKLFKSFYIEKQGQSLVPTSKGIQLIDIVPDDLTSPLLTAEWEERLERIARGQEKSAAFTSDMRTFATELVKAVKNSDKQYRHDNMTRTPCPNCGKFLLEVKTKKGKMLVCQDRECGYRRNLEQTSNARCPKCHKRLTVVGDGRQTHLHLHLRLPRKIRPLQPGATKKTQHLLQTRRPKLHAQTKAARKHRRKRLRRRLGQSPGEG